MSDEYSGGDKFWDVNNGLIPGYNSSLGTINNYAYANGDAQFPQTISGGTNAGYVPPTFYTGAICATPSFSPGGAYSSAQTVTISSATSGASINYTTDGSTPTPTHGTAYPPGVPVTISQSCTLQAIAYETGYTEQQRGLRGLYHPVAASHHHLVLADQRRGRAVGDHHRDNLTTQPR